MVKNIALPMFGAQVAAAKRNPKTSLRLIEEAYLNCTAASLALTEIVSVHVDKMQFSWGWLLKDLAKEADSLTEGVTTVRNRMRRAAQKTPIQTLRNRQAGAAKARAKKTTRKQDHPWDVAEHKGAVRHKRKLEEKNALAHP